MWGEVAVMATPMTTPIATMITPMGTHGCYDTYLVEYLFGLDRSKHLVITFVGHGVQEFLHLATHQSTSGIGQGMREGQGMRGGRSGSGDKGGQGQDMSGRGQGKREVRG